MFHTANYHHGALPSNSATCLGKIQEPFAALQIKNKFDITVRVTGGDLKGARKQRQFAKR